MFQKYQDKLNNASSSIDDSTFTFDGKVVYMKDISDDKEYQESYVRTNEESEDSQQELHPGAKILRDIDEGRLQIVEATQTLTEEPEDDEDQYEENN